MLLFFSQLSYITESNDIPTLDGRRGREKGNLGDMYANNIMQNSIYACGWNNNMEFERCCSMQRILVSCRERHHLFFMKREPYT
jgi:hypothetical protein